MIVDENSRADDMDVNIIKEEKPTDMRAAAADNTENVARARKLSLEQSLEFCRDDECIEVTPETVRIRKVVLDQKERGRTSSRAKRWTPSGPLNGVSRGSSVLRTPQPEPEGATSTLPLGEFSCARRLASPRWR